jgi:hypothetical protein
MKMYWNPYELEKRCEQYQKDIDKRAREAYKEEHRANPSWKKRLRLTINLIFQSK